MRAELRGSGIHRIEQNVIVRVLMSSEGSWRFIWSGVALVGLLLLAGPLWEIPFDLIIYDSTGEFRRQYAHFTWLPKSLDALKWWFSGSWFIGIPLLFGGLVACTLSYLAPGWHAPFKFRLGRFLIAVVAMLICAGAALFIPPLWQGVSGRDFRPQATTLALLVFVLAAVFRRGFRWDLWDFLAGALGTQFLTLVTISHFTGYTWLRLFHQFNLQWLWFMGLFTALPWFLGFGLGSVHRQWRSAGMSMMTLLVLCVIQAACAMQVLAGDALHLNFSATEDWVPGEPVILKMSITNSSPDKASAFLGEAGVGARMT